MDVGAALAAALLLLALAGCQMSHVECAQQPASPQKPNETPAPLPGDAPVGAADGSPALAIAAASAAESDGVLRF